MEYLASECRLDKQDVQDVCGYTALRAKKWSGFICKRAPEGMTLLRYRSTEERRIEECQIAIFLFTSRGAYVNYAVIAMLYIHPFDWKSVVEHDGAV